ncbi:MPN/PAD-1 domain-containing protein [Cavenderia fasciculata]|uniref:MPN/PAD-1 domain-containing protein n=1 Tax=Cavenderia fasciculata TaxID=261658 RepID=F4PTM7_CACFS|nr:MPN/PAD-1 domain-containing protein [Cavenderia fasciculata]EGG21697.1 MPN/PAD-1 domain-containing protein [Cavenderia fasciculata]|eukprot:XP_004359547.1 MPN/PAD-1 domain-containing protein [Cavenderia fasciculata]
MEQPIYLASSIEKLVSEHVQNVEVDKAYKFFHYLQTLNNLTRISSTYKSEGDMEKAYVYLLRFCVLTLEKLPKHPEYNDPKFMKSRDALKREAASKIDELENMKERLVQRYIQTSDERVAKEMQRKQKEREDQERKAKLLEDKKEHDRAVQQEKQDELDQRRLERERKKLEDDNLEEREFIMKKMDIEKKMRQSRFEQQAALLRQEAKMEEKRARELEQLEQQQEQQKQQQQAALVQNENDNSFVYSSSNVTVENVDAATQPVISLNNDDFSFLESKSNKTYDTTSQPQDSSSFLVDPSFAPPPLPAPSAPHVSTPPVYSPTNTVAVSTPKQQEEIRIDPNHKFGYPSIDNITISEIPKQQPPPPQYHQQQQQPQYNNHVNNSNNNNNVYSNQQQQQQPPPQYYPIQQNVHYQVPNYATKSPQYNINNNNRLPATIMSPPVLANGIYTAPPSGKGQQSFLSVAQQNQVQNAANRATNSATATLPSTTTTTNQNQLASPATTAVAKLKTNLDSPEASKKYSKLRRIVICGEIFGDFMKMADNNTRRHIETCGILSGTLSNEVFSVTTLIIPKQEGTTDTCNTIEEQELFEYQLENDLLTLGWIHTHPTQDCFLSAVDVHTHCSYQFLLQEAIAVVISPMANPKLTDPPGMDTVKKCKLKSFHPHPPVGGVPIYTKVDHVDIVWVITFSRIGNNYLKELL